VRDVSGGTERLSLSGGLAPVGQVRVKEGGGASREGRSSGLRSMSSDGEAAAVDGELPVVRPKLDVQHAGSEHTKGPEDGFGRLGGISLFSSMGGFGGSSMKSPSDRAGPRRGVNSEVRPPTGSSHSGKGSLAGSSLQGNGSPQGGKLDGSSVHVSGGADGGSGGARAGLGLGLGRGLRSTGLVMLGGGLRSEAHKVSLGLRRVFGSIEENVPNEAAGEELEENEVEQERRKQIAQVVGLQLNQYTFTEFLGAGGEAWVYGASDGSGNKRAMRVIHGMSLRSLDPSTSSFRRVSLKNAAGARNLRAELAIIRKVEHPAVMRVHEVLDLADTARGLKALCIVMDYVDGGPIVSDAAVRSMNASFWADRAAHHRAHDHAHEGSIFPVDQCVSYFAQALAGLDYLHHNDILHGDIKPSNILLDRARGRVVLCDFGASRLMSVAQDGGGRADGEQRGIVGPTALPCHGGHGRGTLLFFSPEACRLAGSFDGCAADIWAASLVLYLLLFRHLPFSEAEEADKVVAQLLAPGELFVSDDTHWYSSPERKHAREFLLQLLAKNPVKRLSQVPAIMAHKWMARGGAAFAALSAGVRQRPTLRSQLTVRDVSEATTEVTFTANLDSLLNANQFAWLKERASSISEFAVAGAAEAGRRVSVALSDVSLSLGGSLGSIGDRLSDLSVRRWSSLGAGEALHEQDDGPEAAHEGEAEAAAVAETGGEDAAAAAAPPASADSPLPLAVEAAQRGADELAAAQH
jgi:serine/threonine protein kinase